MIKIRRASIEDVKDLQELNNELFIDNNQYDPDLDMDWALGDKGKKYFTKLLKNPKGVCLIAEDGDKKVGYIAAAEIQDIGYLKSRYIEIETMGVSEKYRSAGIGSKLIKECMQWAKKNGFQKGYVNSYFKNKRAIAFYKKSGFFEIDVDLVMDL